MKKFEKNTGIMTGLLVVAVLALSAAARGESAAETFADGKTLLAKGDFKGAMGAFATAARADQSNRDYLTEYAMVRRIVQMRKHLKTETDSRRWQQTADALRSFYMREKIYGEALALDRKVFAKREDARSAARLAETLLAVNKNTEAAKVLLGIDPSKATPTTKALQGIALARDGNLDRAKAIAQTVSLPTDATPGMVYSTARLYAAIGDSEKALDALARSFKAIPPSLLDSFKGHARLCPEFAKLASSDDFAKVMQTKSKVAESKCSGASKCAGCPMRAKCSKGSQ